MSLNQENIVAIDDVNQNGWTLVLDALLKLSSDVIICLSLDYDILDLSVSAESYYVTNKSELVGKNYLQWCEVNHFSLPLVKAIQKITSPINFAFDNVQEITQAEDCENITVVKWTGMPWFDRDNRLCGLLIHGKKWVKPIFVETKNGEFNYLENIINVIPGSVYCKDRNGVYLLCNNAVLEKGNLKNKASIIGKTDFELWPEEAEKIRKHDREVMELGKTLNLEETVILPDGKKMCFASMKMPLRDETGKIVGVVGNSLDVTELKEAKEKAEQANVIKTEFIHNMEHDIRTPFSGIYSLAHLLAEEETDPKKKEYLDEIANSGKALLDFCNTILDFTKIEMGILPVIQKKFDLKMLLEKIVMIERPAITQKKLFFHVESDPQLPTFVIGDDYRLLRILLNLVSNSIKFTKVGGITLRAEVLKLNHKKMILKFIVKDTGAGIPEEKKHFIYERFSRLTPSNKNCYQGTGLGLRVVKQFVHELEGEIELKSKEEAGTTFSILLPFDIPLADQHDVKDEQEAVCV